MQRVGKVFEEFVGGNNVWRLKLAAKTVLWRSGPPADEITHTSEPDVELWLRLELFFLGRLVPETLL